MSGEETGRTAAGQGESTQASMLEAPGLLLIGAAARNAGKTEFACRVLSAAGQAGTTYSGNVALPWPVVGVKVTTVHEAGGLCPRGGEGCGVCATLDTEWCISEETDPARTKDTSRLLRAGAAPVYWLRVLEAGLARGAEALLERLGSSVSWVCESNRLRLVLEPDLFVLVREPGGGAMKPSAASVASLADVVVESDGQTFAPAPEEISRLDGAWTIRRDATAIVLAGGRSTRMGTDKSLMMLDGWPLVSHVVEQVSRQHTQVRLSARDGERFGFLGLPISTDRIAGAGPLVAIASALEDSRTEWNLVVPCDMPKVPARLVTKMFRVRDGVDVVVPLSGEHLEPLFALYRKSCLPAMWDAIRAGERKIIDVFRNLAVRTLPLPSGFLLPNLNTPDEFRKFCGE